MSDRFSPSGSSLWDDGLYQETNPFAGRSYEFPNDNATFFTETQGLPFDTSSGSVCWWCFLLILAILATIVFVGRRFL